MGNNFSYGETEVVHSKTTKKGTKKWVVPVKIRPHSGRGKERKQSPRSLMHSRTGAWGSRA